MLNTHRMRSTTIMHKVTLPPRGKTTNSPVNFLSVKLYSLSQQQKKKEQILTR